MVRDVEQQLAENVTQAKKGKNSQEFPTSSNITKQPSTKKEEPDIFNEYQLDFQTLSIVTTIWGILNSQFYTTK